MTSGFPLAPGRGVSSRAFGARLESAAASVSPRAFCATPYRARSLPASGGTVRSLTARFAGLRAAAASWAGAERDLVAAAPLVKYRHPASTFADRVSPSRPARVETSRQHGRGASANGYHICQLAAFGSNAARVPSRRGVGRRLGAAKGALGGSSFTFTFAFSQSVHAARSVQ